MSVPFSYAAHSHYYSPWFRRGPALEDWQAPAEFPTVTVPFAPGDPYDQYPYIRRYPMLQYAAVPAYARSKDQSVQGSFSRMAGAPAPDPYAHLVPRMTRVRQVEGGASVSVFDPHDDEELSDDDDLDDVEDVLALRYGAAAAAARAKPFKQVSELFKVQPSGKSKADELVEASKRIQREIKRSAKRVQQAPVIPAQPAMTNGQTALVVGGVAAAAVALGWILAQRSR